ncbi:MAG: DUF4332 domain-containing protein [Hyphomonas sp.]
MTLLERVIRAHRCRSTHHFVAFDALSLIGGEEAEGWKSLMLVHHEHLLKGAKAPDDTFKDFKNHVLHVGEGEWGGARAKASEWYAVAVDLLRRKRWSDAAWALGVLSHYYADPIQPFHTGQTEAEGVIHRAVEWSIAKSRPEIDARIAQQGYPEIEIPGGPGFVSDMVREGALRANAHYFTFIDHYDLDAGVADPPSGLDETMRSVIVDLIAYATAGFAAILSRAIEEAAVSPPKVDLTLQGYIETLDIPLRWITAKLEDMSDRSTVEKMYREYQKTGKVIRTLPEDDKLIREQHAKEVRRISLKALNAEPIAPLGTKRDIDMEQAAAAPLPLAALPETEEARGVLTVEAAPPLDRDPGIEEGDVDQDFEDETAVVEVPAADDDEEFSDDEDLDTEEEYEADIDEIEDEEGGEEEFEAEAEEEPAPPPAIVAPAAVHRRSNALTFESPVVDAPSIGPKTAVHLSKAGIETVGDLIICDPDETAELISVRHITVDAIETWQMQATLMIEVPGLRVHDAQLLVGAGISSREDLANASAATVFELAMEFLQTSAGSRVLRPGETLEEDEVEEWIEMAQETA